MNMLFNAQRFKPESYDLRVECGSLRPTSFKTTDDVIVVTGQCNASVDDIFLVSGRVLACQQEFSLVLAKTALIHY